MVGANVEYQMICICTNLHKTSILPEYSILIMVVSDNFADFQLSSATRRLDGRKAWKKKTFMSEPLNLKYTLMDVQLIVAIVVDSKKSSKIR